jgi:hypothetical protein
MSTIKQFVVAVQTGQTNTTRALTAMLVRPGRYTSDPNWQAFQQQYCLNTLPGWLRKMLKDNNLSDKEIDHMDEWPDEEKETLRLALVAAIQANRNTVFSWHLYDGAVSANHVEGANGGGDLQIAFRSPRANVRSSALTFGDISVLIR